MSRSGDISVLYTIDGATVIISASIVIINRKILIGASSFRITTISSINETGYIIIGTSYYRITIVNMTFVFSLTLRANISVNTSSFIVTGIFCTCVIIITYNISILRIFTTEIIITWVSCTEILITVNRSLVASIFSNTSI